MLYYPELAVSCKLTAYSLRLIAETMSIRTIYLKWAERHVNRLNVILHVVGIPLTIAAIPLLVRHSYAWAGLLFVSGYALQFVGHAIEGNKSGEQILFEKILRRKKP